MKQVKRYLLIAIGFMSILFGLIGIALPLLPTTPFFILALACFARSSTHFHQKLLTAPYIGETLQQWERDKCIDKQRKKQIMLVIVSSFFISIILINYFYLQLMLIIIMFILLFFIHRLAER